VISRSTESKSAKQPSMPWEHRRRSFFESKNPNQYSYAYDFLGSI
jgi:hypothetical protein